MLGVFLLPPFTRLGHECQDLWSPCDGMHAYTDQTSLNTLIRKSFGGMESEPMLTPREKSPLPEKKKIFLRGGSNPRRCITQDSEPNTLPTELLRPRPGFDSRFRRTSFFQVESYQSGAGIAQLVVLGLAVHSVANSILLWGHFPVEGIFPLELTWVQTPVPQKTPSDESINGGLVCAHMHFVARTQKILTFMS